MRTRRLGQIRPDISIQDPGEATTGERADILVWISDGTLDIAPGIGEFGLPPSDIGPLVDVGVQPYELEILPAEPDDEIEPFNGPLPSEPDRIEVGGGALEGISEFWEEHKKKILIGGGVLTGLVILFKLRK